MEKFIEWCRDNVSLLTFSGSTLIFTSAYGLYAINKYSYANYGVFKYRMAAVGLCMVIGDAANAMIYKTINPIEPLFTAEKEPRPSNANLIFPMVETICTDAVLCLICSLYVHYNVAFCGRFQYFVIKIAKEVDWFFKNVFRPECRFWSSPFVELFLSANMVSFGLLHENQYPIMAAVPYQIATLFFHPGNYYSKRKNRTIYNFLMIPYVLLMTRALCQPVKIMGISPDAFYFHLELANN